jgi:hypothetical protein
VFVFDGELMSDDETSDREAPQLKLGTSHQDKEWAHADETPHGRQKGRARIHFIL